MKFIEREEPRQFHMLELTRRNLEILLRKLDDPLSAATLVDGDNQIVVRAVENDEHYSNRKAGDMLMPSTGEIL